MKARCHRDAGFTIIELLVAITLLALITSMAFGVFRFGAQVWDRRQQSEAGPSAHDIAFRMRTLLERAVLPEIRQADFSVRVPFRLEAGRLEFLTTEHEGLTAWQMAARPAEGTTHFSVRRTVLSGPDKWFGPIAWGTPIFSKILPGTVSFVAFDGRGSMAEWPPGPGAPKVVTLTMTDARSTFRVAALLRQAK